MRHLFFFIYKVQNVFIFRSLLGNLVAEEVRKIITKNDYVVHLHRLFFFTKRRVHFSIKNRFEYRMLY